MNIDRLVAAWGSCRIRVGSTPGARSRARYGSAEPRATSSTNVCRPALRFR
ncbi:hypothetical protein ACIA58_35900 [Kribbella sp. NPDC051586]|uniref:hypothetical protein n=1 Tax=Kribbella sp. NPDC051586 TaxID=3364118 RepID=UPI00379FDFFE